MQNYDAHANEYLIVNNNKQSARKLAEGIRGRVRVLSTAKGRGNRWWENIREENSLFGIAMMRSRPLASAWMEFAVNVMCIIWTAVTVVGYAARS